MRIEGRLNQAGTAKGFEGVAPGRNLWVIPYVAAGREERKRQPEDSLDAFDEARLLTFDRSPVTGQPTVEVAHEALLQEWRRLREWLDESRADIRMQRVLGNAAAEWLGAGRDPGFLLRGSRLEQFAGWADETQIALTQDEQAQVLAVLTSERFCDKSVAQTWGSELGPGM